MVKKIISRSAVSLALTSFILAGLLGLAPIPAAAATVSISSWWPTNGAHMQGVQPFKVMISGLDVSQYDMFWQVDGGQLNSMNNNYTGYQHKEASVDVSGWKWHGSGPYVINFVARQGGTVIAQQSETIYIDNNLPVASAVPAKVTTAAPVVTTASTIPATTPAVAALVSSNSSLYVIPNSEAAEQAVIWASSNPTGAIAMKVLASQSTASWFGNWNSNVGSDVHALVVAAEAANSIPTLVAYNIPERDCGGFSAGGANNPAGYTSWIQSFAQGLGSSKAIVILEPDAIADIGCLSSADQATRLSLLGNAVSTIKKDPNAKVYIDAGHSNWIDAATMARELSQANVAQADGFSLNVSNFMSNSSEITYGQQVSSQISGKHFVVDTSRNGNGSTGQWCNPSGMAIGTKPTLQTGNALVDAFLWIKTPGESDGPCNGGPSAGMWWPSYAQQLVQNAH